MFFNTDRFDRTWATGIKAVFGILLAIPVLLVFGLVGYGISQHRNPTPEEWFRRIVEVDPGQYTEIQHFMDEGIDVSHHFRFQFRDEADIHSIIRRHQLSRDLLGSPLRNQFQPDWYTPELVPLFPFGAVLSNDSYPDVRYTLFVDYKAKTAFFVYEAF